jgi:hypothetical protein
MRIVAKYVLSVLLSALLIAWGAVPPAIGVVTAGGEFRLDNATIRGNGTLCEGNVVETLRVRTELRIASGARISLAPQSRGQVFQNSATLESGTGELTAPKGFVLEANGLRIAPLGGEAQVVISPGSSRVRVSSLQGEVNVRNAQGVLVGRVFSDHGLEFDSRAGASTAVKLKGKVTRINGKYLITDDITHVTVELRGKGLDQFVGKVVTLTGSVIPGAAPVAGAAEVVAITSISVVAGGALLGGAALGAIIGGVAAGVTIGALAATGTFSENPQPVSR